MPHVFAECAFAQIMRRTSLIGCVPVLLEHESIMVWFDKLIGRWKLRRGAYDYIGGFYIMENLEVS